MVTLDRKAPLSADEAHALNASAFAADEYEPFVGRIFNDQKTGRLTLLRHFLDHTRHKRRPLPKVKLPPLSGKPRRERFGALKPIRTFRA